MVVHVHLRRWRQEEKCSIQVHKMDRCAGEGWRDAWESISASGIQG